jgi:seryl-tRNA synthetase
VIELKVVRSDPDRVRESQRRRGEDVTLVDALLRADEVNRAAGASYDRMRNEQKELGRRIGPLQARAKSGDPAAASEVEGLMAQAKDLSDAVKTAETERDTAGAQAMRLMLALSNIIELEAPVGGEEDFVVLQEVGTPRDFATEGFEPRDHLELGTLLGAIDVERAAKVSGARFYYLTGPGALLELALINLAISQAVAHGLTPVIPPVLVNPPAMEGTGFLGQAAENVYRVELDDMYLVGTSEVALAAYHSDEILDAADLPLRYSGISTCFRREAGTYGKDTRGIIRVHQFDKVEMFSFCRPQDAVAEHQRLLAWEREFLDAIEVPYRVIDVASGDLGSSAARKFDCEAWVPTQGKYREVTSTSNCTEVQARRLAIRMREDGEVRPVATLNGTLCAIPRIIVAILENHQQADGSVIIPVALRPYLGGREKFEPVVRSR